MLFLFPMAAFCCTDFLIKTTDQTCINGRSMEFGHVFQTSIVVHPRAERVTSQAPLNKYGLTWTSLYGYVGLFDEGNQYLDGFNEKGLSVGALWFPDGKYPDPESLPEKRILSYMDLPLWILGNFATIEELKPALETVHVYAYKVPVFNAIPPIHYAIHDATGASLVVEFINGKMCVYDNRVGVLTNSPEFPWQVTNLRNFISLKAINAQTVTLDGTVLTTTGQGSGLQGIPGDWTPPSRFVRIALFKDFLEAPPTSKAGVLAAIHLLNTVDIPYGGIRSAGGEASDFTQWIVIKDLTHQMLYYRTYSNQNIYSFELTEKLIAAGAVPTKIPISLESVEPISQKK